MVGILVVFKSPSFVQDPGMALCASNSSIEDIETSRSQELAGWPVSKA